MKLRFLLPMYVLWRLWRRDRRRLSAYQLEERDESSVALAEVTLERAVETLDIELGTADTIDLKAVGLATADVAGLTILIAVHRDVPQWWLSAAVMGFAGLCFILVLRQRIWVYSPPPEKFRKDNSGKSRPQILRAMRTYLEGYRDTNEPLLIYKAVWFKRGYQALALGLTLLGGTTLYHIIFG